MHRSFPGEIWLQVLGRRGGTGGWNWGLAWLCLFGIYGSWWFFGGPDTCACGWPRSPSRRECCPIPPCSADHGAPAPRKAALLGVIEDQGSLQRRAGRGPSLGADAAHPHELIIWSGMGSGHELLADGFTLDLRQQDWRSVTRTPDPGRDPVPAARWKMAVTQISSPRPYLFMHGGSNVSSDVEKTYFSELWRIDTGASPAGHLRWELAAHDDQRPHPIPRRAHTLVSYEVSVEGGAVLDIAVLSRHAWHCYGTGGCALALLHMRAVLHLRVEGGSRLVSSGSPFCSATIRVS